MKVLHTADWHVGRTLNGWSLLEEQKWALSQIVDLAVREQVDGVIVAGDLYDRAVPPVEAIKVFHQTLAQLVLEHGIAVYAISGNHDGAERLHFGREFFQSQGLHLTTRLEEAFDPIELEDCQIFLLPFIDPIDARIYYKDAADKEIRTIAQALTYILEDMKVKFDPTKAHVLVTHFAVSKRGDQEGEALRELMLSETTNTIGGLNTVTSDLFKDFDYVALGHIHTRMASPTERVRYSGSPVAFNVKEAKRQEDKGVYLVELDASGNCQTTFHPLEIRRPIKVLSGTFDHLIAADFYQSQPCHQAWFAFDIELDNRRELEGINVRARLEEIYGPDIVEINFRTSQDQPLDLTALNKGLTELERLSPQEVVGDFYQFARDGQVLSPFQADLVQEIFQTLERTKQ